VRLVALQSIMNIKVSTVSVECTHCGLTISSVLCGFPLMPSPVPLRAPSSSSPELFPLFRVRPDCHLPEHRSIQTPPRVRLPIATAACRVHQPASFHTRLRSALGVSHTLDGLLLHTPCGLISSHSHVRDSHFRGFPRCQAGLPHRQPMPSCR
jgi:hypothetical protein